MLMKEYIIWLKNGNCIQGKFDAEVGAKLLVEFWRRRRKRHYEFYDTDGMITLDMRQVMAIGFNNITDKHKAGY